jgi:hypothetical protein
MRGRMGAIVRCRYCLTLAAVGRRFGFGFGIHTAIVRRETVIMCKWGSGQWAVDSGQWTVDSGQWAVWAVDSGQWAVGSGQWTVGRDQKGEDRGT